MSKGVENTMCEEEGKERLMMAKEHMMMMGGEHMMMGKEHLMKLWEKLGDSEKKTLMLRLIDAKIMKKEQLIKDLEYKVETIEMIKNWIEKM